MHGYIDFPNDVEVMFSGFAQNRNLMVHTKQRSVSFTHTSYRILFGLHEMGLYTCVIEPGNPAYIDLSHVMRVLFNVYSKTKLGSINLSIEEILANLAEAHKWLTSYPLPFFTRDFSFRPAVILSNNHLNEISSKFWVLGDLHPAKIELAAGKRHWEQIALDTWPLPKDDQL